MFNAMAAGIALKIVASNSRRAAHHAPPSSAESARLASSSARASAMFQRNAGVTWTIVFTVRACCVSC
jgi:hypothetical protein